MRLIATQPKYKQVKSSQVTLYDTLECSVTASTWSLSSRKIPEAGPRLLISNIGAFKKT